MKKLTLLILSMAVFTTAFSQTYFVKVDSAKFLKLKTGDDYTIQSKGATEKLRFESIKDDSFHFEQKTIHYKEITGLKNKKRKVVLDAILFPATIGSCLAMSAFPVAYLSGYFAADTGGMLKAIGFLAGETILFYIARNYLSSNKKWIDLSTLDSLKINKRA